MVCPGFFIKKLLDFTYVRSKDNEKIISLDRINDRDDIDGIDGNGIDQDPEGN
tara:strand:- start:100 stop:258 length:159 start_codon:yes stop_codon:yes gene_type:complete